eukprot:TRINITY_DN67996_c0_g1_i1.p1 TRINITY_DN67996_c0_g1~~TRINITY_DN67996_c0_g1_i1.p1  ORF type:complete len:190 (+),score=18.45 TRINITY_DN67996_c0_g1_i1:73-642(+)
MEVPVLTLIDDQEKEKKPVMKVKRSDSTHVDLDALRSKGQHNKKEEAIQYFNKYHIPQTMNSLVTQLLLQKPEHPISFCIQFLRTASAMTSPVSSPKAGGSEQQSYHPQQEAYSVDYMQQLRKKITDEDSKEYILSHKLPWLFDDLLSNLLLEKPEDPHVFCLSWLRWNRKKYDENDKETDYGITMVNT